MRRIPRHDAELGGLDLFARLDKPSPGTWLESPERLSGVLDEIKAGVEKSMTNPARIGGWHAQIMFAQVAQALGGCHLLKEEDAGSTWVDESLEIRPADYRIILPDRRQLLVEVKNHHSEARVPAPFKMRTSDLEALIQYGALAAGRPLVAIYWTRPGLWTLVDPVHFGRRGDRADITLVTALKENEMGLVGDYMIGLIPPLEMDAEVEPVEGSAIEVQDDGSRNLQVRIQEVHFRAGGVTLTGKKEKSVAVYLMLNGRWPETLDSEFDVDSPKRVTFRFEPEEWPRKQGFAMIGFLSELFTRSYWQRTTEDGRITRIAATIDPASEGFAIARDYSSDELPL